MGYFWYFISALGGTAALVGAAAFLAKLLIQNSLSKELEDHKYALLRDVETHKADLNKENSKALDSAKFEFEKELISRRGEVDRLRDWVKHENESEQEREKRLQLQLQRWANPILSAISDLEYRLNNILDQQGHVGLSDSNSDSSEWSADYTYFMASTSYYFAQYFCWVRLMHNQLARELFQSSSEMNEFLSYIELVADELSSFPYKGVAEKPVENNLRDRQVFRLQQRAIGELVLERTAVGEQILTYREFLDRWLDTDDQKFIRHVAPLEAFLRDIQPGLDMRWVRLIGMQSQLKAFGEVCRHVLSH